MIAPYKKMTREEPAGVQVHATDVVFVPTRKIKSIYRSSRSLTNQVEVASIYTGRFTRFGCFTHCE